MGERERERDDADFRVFGFGLGRVEDDDWGDCVVWELESEVRKGGEVGFMSLISC